MEGEWYLYGTINSGKYHCFYYYYSYSVVGASIKPYDYQLVRGGDTCDDDKIEFSDADQSPK